MVFLKRGDWIRLFVSVCREKRFEDGIFDRIWLEEFIFYYDIV